MRLVLIQIFAMKVFWLTFSITLISILGLPSRVLAQRIPSYLKKNELFGRVKSITETCYLPVVVGDSIIKGDVFKTESADCPWETIENLYFDTAGRLTEKSLVCLNGKLISKHSFHYDFDKGIEAERIDYGKYGSYGPLYSYYDENENLIQFSYDPSPNDGDDSKNRIIKYYTYKNNKRIKESTSNGSREEYYYYDDNSNLIKTEVYEDGKMTYNSHSEYLYNTDKTINTVKNYSELRLTDITYYSYDKDKRLFEMKYEDYKINGEIYSTTLTKYGINEKTVLSTDKDKIGNVKYLWRDDSQKNWTQRVELRYGKPYQIIERVITYHER